MVREAVYPNPALVLVSKVVGLSLFGSQDTSE